MSVPNRPSFRYRTNVGSKSATDERAEANTEILRTHLIEPEYLRAGDFDGFYQARMNALSDLIGTAIGKAVVLDHGTDEPEIELDEIDTEAHDNEDD